MKYRTMGKTGFKVSEIGFGAMQFGFSDQKDEDSYAALNLAIDKGVNFIDTAAAYGNGRSEKVIAEILKDRSERIYITTKIFGNRIPGRNPFHLECGDVFADNYLMKNTEERLKFLSVDKIDILLLHTWSSRWNDNPRPIEVLQKLKDKGLVSNIGISIPEYDRGGALEIIKRDIIDVVELPYNIFDQNMAASILPAAEKHSVGVIARQPFEDGLLTGKYNKDTTFTEGDFRNLYFSGAGLTRALKRVENIRKDLQGSGNTIAQAALLFVLAQQSVGTVIPGMRNPGHVEANIAVSDMEPLPDELTEKLRKHFWIKSFWIQSVLDRTRREDDIQ